MEQDTNTSGKPMNPKVKKKWVDALRSGKYKQTRGALCTEGGYCCLGVLCDIYARTKRKKGIGFKTLLSNPTKHFHIDGRAISALALPAVVYAWAGLSDSNPDITDETGLETSLASLNDEHLLSFNKIADIIDEKL